MKGRGRERIGFAPLVLFVLAFSACGARTQAGEGDELAASCEVATPCGGNLVGHWEARELCAELFHVRVLSACEASSVSDVDPQITGFRNYAADGTYQIAITYGGSLRLGWPSECALDPVRVTSCQRFAEDLLARGQQILDSAECAPSGDECLCDLVLLPYEWRDTGRWTVSASGRLFEAQSGVTEYCVEGDELRLTTTGGLGGLETTVFVRR
jgi:hypothetical protein